MTVTFMDFDGRLPWRAMIDYENKEENCPSFNSSGSGAGCPTGCAQRARSRIVGDEATAAFEGDTTPRLFQSEPGWKEKTAA